jgi:hypothetical protein
MSAQHQLACCRPQGGEIAGRRGHDVLIMLLVLLGALAMIAAVAWLTGHLIVFAGIALLMWSVFCLGHHEQTTARPGRIQPRQARPEEPASVVAAAPPLADYGEDGELPDDRSATVAGLGGGPDPIGHHARATPAGSRASVR